MSDSFCQIFAHVVFCTRNRERLLDGDVRPHVFAHLSAVAREMGCPFALAGGTEDHAHLLMDIGERSLPLDIVAKVKEDSLRFVQGFGLGHESFNWHDGYGIFSISPSKVGLVQHYIESQDDYHRRLTFDEEFHLLWEKCAVCC